MGISKLLGGAGVALALVAMAAPAEAQRWGGRHRHHDRIDGGDVLLGALLAGGIIAIASAADRERAPREAAEDAYAEPPADAPGEPNVQPTNYIDLADADSAADACAQAAESAALRHARIARVGSIDAIDPSGPNWLVRGTIELRNDYRSRGTEHGFRCNIAGAGVPTVRIDGYSQ